MSAGENIHENGTHENGVVESVDQTTPTPIHYLLNVCAFTFLSCSKFIIFLNTLQYIRSTFVISWYDKRISYSMCYYMKFKDCPFRKLRGPWDSQTECHYLGDLVLVFIIVTWIKINHKSPKCQHDLNTYLNLNFITSLSSFKNYGLYIASLFRKFLAFELIASLYSWSLCLPYPWVCNLFFIR